MHALIVVSHPEPDSLTHSVAAWIAEGVAQSDVKHSSEIADLSAESFDPRFNAVDLAIHRRVEPVSADIAAEQARIDRADALVLVYPVYWWSMPGLLKGWIDRVFTNGWAYDDSLGHVVKKLRHLPIHLLAIGGADMRTYARHGYFGAMKLQIDHGIFGYCGAQVATSELLLEHPTQAMDDRRVVGQAIGRSLFRTKGASESA